MDESSEKPYILSLDIGTTSIRAFLYDREASIIGHASTPIELIYPEPGYVEQDPQLLWNQCKLVIKEALQQSGKSYKQIRSVGLSSQRSSCLTWNRITGEPVHNILTWQDSRATKICNTANNSFTVRALQSASSIAYFFVRGQRFAAGSAISFSTVQACTRLAWVLQHNENAKQLLAEGNLLFGTIDCWLVWKMTGGKVHATDYSNASATGLWDPFIMAWNPFVSFILDIPISILPKVLDTSGYFGQCVAETFGIESEAEEEGIVIDIPLTSVVGDQQAALFGQCCFYPGDAKVTMGTGCFVNLNTGKHPYASKHGLYPMVAWKIGEETCYIMEGTDRSSGSVIEWAKEMGFFSDLNDLEDIANSVPDTRGVYFVPAFSGLNHPYLDDTARGTLVGLDRATKKNHIVRAILEGLVMRMYDMYEALTEDVPIPITILKADGGVCRNNFIMQTAANITQTSIERAEQTEMSSQGAAFLAGLAVGFWKDKEELSQLRKIERVFNPIQTEKSEQKEKIWHGRRQYQNH